MNKPLLRLQAAAIAVVAGLSALGSAPNGDDDPFRWLEDVQGERALERSRNRLGLARKVIMAFT